jgi:Ca-activated chloride channel homolog
MVSEPSVGIAMFRFAEPYFLLLTAVVPLLIWYRRRSVTPALASASVGPAVTSGASPALAISRLLPGCAHLALILMTIALARPQWGTRQIVMDTKGVNIILAVDLSESMAALDFRHDSQVINRLEAIKIVVQDFISRRNGDRIGMVVFGSHAYTQLPLNRDYSTITSILERLTIGAAGKQTAIGDAIGIALKRLEDIKSRSNVIILLSDGRSNSGELEPLAAADIARQKKVRIYTIGVGGQGRAPFLIEDPIFGKRYIYQRVDLDETTLKQIAERTGGLYFRAKDLQGLEKIYHTIDRMEKTDVKVKTYADYNDLYVDFLLPALGLLTIWIVLSNTRFLKVP